MDITKEIILLRKKIDEDKEKQAKAEGAYQSILDQLKKDCGVDSLEDGKAKLKIMETELENMEEDLTESITNFSNKYGIS